MSLGGGHRSCLYEQCWAQVTAQRGRSWTVVYGSTAQSAAEKKSHVRREAREDRAQAAGRAMHERSHYEYVRDQPVWMDKTNLLPSSDPCGRIEGEQMTIYDPWDPRSGLNFHPVVNM